MSTQIEMFSPSPIVRSHHPRGKIHGPAKDVAAEFQRNERKAAKQDAAVLQLFRDGGRPLSPSEVWWRFGREYEMNVPITSVRRAMSNLSKRGLLYMSADRIKGPWGRMEHRWFLNEGESK